MVFEDFLQRLKDACIISARRHKFVDTVDESSGKTSNGCITFSSLQRISKLDLTGLCSSTLIHLTTGQPIMTIGELQRIVLNNKKAAKAAKWEKLKKVHSL